MTRKVSFRPQAEAEAVYFRAIGDAIVVLAVHGRQHQRRWQSRV